MEKAESWDRNSVVSQLTQGMELAYKLENQLHHSNNSREACGILVEKIVSCYDNALALLNCMGFLENGETTALIESSPRSEVSDQDFKDHVFADVHKKRKNLPKWSEEVRVCSGTGFEGQLDDGYNWRKYGQKDISGATHPRAYYRCTHRYTQGCLATRQVQRGEDDPSILKVVYKGKHSCVLKQTKEMETNDEDSQRLSQQMMIGPEPGLKVEPQELNPENVETQFLSEPTSEFYFSMSPCHLNEIRNDHSFLSSESYFTEINLNPTSAANFPSVDMDFLIDQVDFDSHVPEAADYFSHVQDSPESKM